MDFSTFDVIPTTTVNGISWHKMYKKNIGKYTLIIYSNNSFIPPKEKKLDINNIKYISVEIYNNSKLIRKDSNDIVIKYIKSLKLAYTLHALNGDWYAMYCVTIPELEKVYNYMSEIR